MGWRESRLEAIISATILGLVLPPIYTIEDHKGNKHIIKGQQYFNALIGFLNGEFRLENGEHRTKDFSGLPPRLQGRLEDYEMMICTVSPTPGEEFDAQSQEKILEFIKNILGILA